ncbi:unnamed protein product [Owenia fusiformis]|uniref:Uncharacterized protein n=1 Tax=Owenia fusiformis TaxID=6347 RepID=A0A8J1TZL5_OWEFU|nr:unnamed protein product [Owenia fusiformis]
MSHPEEFHARLTIFVTIVAGEKNIINRYRHQRAELEYHTAYIEEFVDDICSSFGGYSDFAQVKTRFSRGSYYERTKIIEPNEYDYLPVLSLTDDVAVEVCDVEEDCKLAGQGYKRVKILPGQLQKHFKNLRRNVLCKQNDGVYLKTEIRYSLVEELDSYLKRNHSQNYLGRKNHNEDPAYEIGQFSLHDLVHGPSVCIRVGGPLCTTDIDLCFCIQKSPGCVLVPAFVSSAKCNVVLNENHWTESVLQLQKETGIELPLSDGQHKHVFLTLKFISHLYDKIYWFLFGSCTPDGLISSYAYKLLMQHHSHRQKGPDYNIGKWLEDIVYFIFGFTRKEGDGRDVFRAYGRGDDVYLPDVHFHERKVKVINGDANKGELITLLWIYKHVEHNDNTVWWKRLLDDDFPNNVDKPVHNGLIETECVDKDGLDSLLRSVEYVMTIRSGKPERPPECIWRHMNGAITRVIIDDQKPLDIF